MGDAESRREDARVEDLQERGLRNGSLVECPECGDIRSAREIEEIMEEMGGPMCQRCGYDR